MSFLDRRRQNDEVIFRRLRPIRWDQRGHVNVPTAQSQTVREGSAKQDLQVVVTGMIDDQYPPGFSISAKRQHRNGLTRDRLLGPARFSDLP
jgi:hypothetical protein